MHKSPLKPCWVNYYVYLSSVMLQTMFNLLSENTQMSAWYFLKVI